jgi:hypothetical protein
MKAKAGGLMEASSFVPSRQFSSTHTAGQSWMRKHQSQKEHI